MKPDKSVIGMVHVQALPGTPKNKFNIREIIGKAVSDASILADVGVDAIMIENMHDRPYLNRKVGPEITAAMTAVAIELNKNFEIPMGIQILAGANKEALAVAQNAEFDFIRAEGFVFGHLADEGMMNSDAAELLRFRKQIGAENIKVYTDIKKKHSAHSLTSDVSIADTAKAAQFFLSDGIIVSGNSTGKKASVEEVREIKESVDLPVIIGSGLDVYNIEEFWEIADAFIVGSSIKFEGNWENDVDPARVKQFMQKITQLRKS